MIWFLSAFEVITLVLFKNTLWIAAENPPVIGGMLLCSPGGAHTLRHTPRCCAVSPAQ
jgi:hypothetical protein